MNDCLPLTACPRKLARTRSIDRSIARRHVPIAKVIIRRGRSRVSFHPRRMSLDCPSGLPSHLRRKPSIHPSIHPGVKECRWKGKASTYSRSLDRQGCTASGDTQDERSHQSPPAPSPACLPT
ncbi:hypothetical protein LX32DRAFT_380115 [Colletotrichum zoysiae]|uniref:Uncharacterized protein n=1 Tax=Colletotrichum zoysiae TaxID=1216348 RepID=A0AAD9HHE9_9PEZI|nr:hypothetical protein LX32DRAFT_380115 [Colletotrichum zoysiae]